MDKKVEQMRRKVECAILELHKEYRRAPWIFLTEADIRSELFSELRPSYMNAIKTKSASSNKAGARTRSLHAELPARKLRTGVFQKVDLCLVKPKEMSDVSREDWAWDLAKSVGIEIKFNQWIKGRRKNSEDSLKKDLKKLDDYAYGFLVFVDHHTTFGNEKEWQKFIDSAMKKSKYWQSENTLGTYYLSPKLKKPISYKPPRNDLCLAAQAKQLHSSGRSAIKLT